MKTFSTILLAATAAFALASAPAAYAAGSIGAGPGFVPATVIDFEQTTEGALLDTYYAGLGVTFNTLGQTYGFAGAFAPDLAGGGAINFSSVPVNDFTINFSSLQSNAAFSIVTDYSATLSSYLGNTLVDSVVYSGSYQPGADWVRFLGSNFNSIRFTGTGDQLALIDNLSFDNAGAVPEPATCR